MEPPLASRETEPPGSGAPCAGAATSPTSPHAALQPSPATRRGPPLATPSASAHSVKFVPPVRPGEAFRDILLRDFHVTAVPGASSPLLLDHTTFPRHPFQLLLHLVDAVLFAYGSSKPPMCALGWAVGVSR